MGTDLPAGDQEPRDQEPLDQEPRDQEPRDQEPRDGKVAGEASAGQARPMDVTIDLADRESRLADLLDAYLEQLQQGQTPDVSQWKRDHPDLADALESCLAGLAFIHGGGDPSATAGLQAEAGSNQEGPRLLGDFRVLREVGRGGMGAVYEAEQISLQRRVALKVLHFGAMPDPQAVERFRREAETVAKLHHTNIVPIFSVGSDHGVSFYAMQFIDGRSLDIVLKERADAIDPDTVAEWGLQASEALAHAHQRGVIHRDVKPSNLILDNEQRIWLTDFGLAKRQDDVTLSRTGAILGTPRYMSPEQALSSSKRIDHRTDIFSLGATLYELATGFPAFAAPTPHEVMSQILSSEPESPRVLRATIPRDLETIIIKCMAKQAEQRYKTAREVADDLRAFLERRPIQARRPTLIERAQKWLQKRRTVASTSIAAVGATLLVLALGAITWLAVQRSQRGQLMLKTEHPRLVAHLLDEDGDIESSHTVPTQSPVETRAGQRRMHVTADRQWGRTSLVNVAAKDTLSLNLRVGDDAFAPEIDVRMTCAVVRTVGGARIFHLGKEGVRRVPLQGFDEPDWFLPLEGPQVRARRTTNPPGAPGSPAVSTEEGWPVWPWPYNDQADGPGRFSLRPYVLGDVETEQRYGARPVVAPDVNGDGVSDLILAARHQAWVRALSGRNGKILWTVWRGQEPFLDFRSQHRASMGQLATSSGATSPPLLLRDLDGDGTRDVCVAFHDAGTNPARRWIEAISGANGQTIWTSELDSEWFSLGPNEKPPQQFVIKREVRHRFGQAGNDSTTENGRTSRRPPVPAAFQIASSSDYVNGRLQQVRFGAQDLIVFAAGDHIAALHVSSGDQAWAHKVSPRPASDLRWAKLDEDAHPDAVFLQELPVGGAGAKYQRPRLVAWSGGDAKTLWSHNLNSYWPATYGTHAPDPRWPLVVDMDGDGTAEVVAASESSYQGVGMRGTPFGRISVYEGETGVERWSARMLTKDQQTNHFEVGPDIDGDGCREVFAAAVWSRNEDVHIEAFGGVDGKTLWTRRVANRHDILSGSKLQISDLIWRDVAKPDRRELIVVASPTRHWPNAASMTIALNAHSGEISGMLTESPSQIQCIDIDADGSEETVSFFPKDERDPFDGGGALNIARGMGVRYWSRAGGQMTPLADVNGDGVVDLLSSVDMHRLRMLSGVDGSVIWEADYEFVFGAEALSGTEHRVVATHDLSQHAPTAAQTTKDLDGDGIPDLIVATYVFSHRPSSAVFAVSGGSGKPLWGLKPPIRVCQSIPVLDLRDLDSDGRLELIYMAAVDWAMPVARNSLSSQDANYWIAVFDASTGKLKWKHELVPLQAGSMQSHNMNTKLQLAYGDLNGDGVDDIVTPAHDPDTQKAIRWTALTGDEGKVLWQKKGPVTRHFSPLQYVHPPVIGDLDNDGLGEAILLSYTQNTGAEANSSVSLTAVDGSGAERWSWSGLTHFNDSANAFDNDAAPSRPRPLVVRGPGGEPHVVWQAHSLDQGVKELIVLDANGRLVHRKPVGSGQSMHGGAMFPRDIDADGSDEILLFTDQQTLACLSLRDDIQERWSFSLHAASNGNMATPFGGEDSRWVTVFDSSRQNDLYLLDLQTGQPVWKSIGPKPRHEGMSMAMSQVAWLTGPATLERAAPVAFYAWADHCLVQEAHGLERAFASSLERAKQMWIGRDRDPRWVRTLPWAQPIDADELLEMVRFFVTAGAISLAMLLLPIWYLLKLVRMRRFGINALLFVFVLTGVFLSAAHFPISRIDSGIRARLGLSLAVGPSLLLAGNLLYWLAGSQWKKAAFWIGFALFLAAAFASIGAFAAWQYAPGIPGERYSWDGAWVIVLPGLYAAAALFSIQLLAVQCWKAILGTPRHIPARHLPAWQLEHRPTATQPITTRDA